MHEVLVNRLGGLSLPRKSVVRLTDRPDMTLDVYRGRKTTNQQKPSSVAHISVTAYQILFIFGLEYLCSIAFNVSYLSPWVSPQSGTRDQ